MLNASATPTCTYTLISYYTTDFVYIYMYLFRAPLKCNNEYLNTTILTALTCMYTCIRLGPNADFGNWLRNPCVTVCIYSIVHMQGITNARLRSRATAFVSACERFCLRLRTRSSPSSNAFASACERVRFSSQTRSPPPTNAFASLRTQTQTPFQMALDGC